MKVQLTTVIAMLAFVDSSVSSNSPHSPVIACVATWKFGAIAVDACAPLLEGGLSAIDCVERGIRAVESDNQEQYFVGVGGCQMPVGSWSWMQRLWTAIYATGQ